MRILHVIKQINSGGGTIGLIRQCEQSCSFAHNVILSIREPAGDSEMRRLQELGIQTVAVDSICEQAAVADVVQFEWWNNPEINNLIVNTAFPPSRLLLHSRVHCEAPLMCPSANLLRRVDSCSITTPSCFHRDAFRTNLMAAGLPSPDCIFSAANSPNVIPKVRGRQNQVVYGYLGTVEPLKLYPRFLDLIEATHERVPNSLFIFAGDGTLEEYRREAALRNLADVVRFIGHQENISEFLGQLDVFFYPLNKFTYATSEKALQEAMLVGLPCVVFPHGGIRDFVTASSGLIAHSPNEFIDHCVHLGKSPEARAILGASAREQIEKLELRSSMLERLKKLYNGILGLQKKARPALKIAGVNLLEYCVEGEGPPIDPMDLSSNEQRSHIVDFVEGEYRDWVKENC